MKASIGFLGLGAMGFGMAKHLRRAGYTLHVSAHRNREPVDHLVSGGAVEYPDAASLAEVCDVIVLCLPNSEVVWSVLNEMEDGMHGGQILIDTGTSSLSATRKVQRRLTALGIDFAEAPLAGGAGQAEAGKLGALVGSDPDTFNAIEPILETFCASIQHFGGVGAGGRAKMVNNYMVFGIAALVHEAFHLADEAGVDWAKLYDAVIRGSADSGVFRRIIGNAIKSDYRGYIFNVAGEFR